MDLLSMTMRLEQGLGFFTVGIGVGIQRVGLSGRADIGDRPDLIHDHNGRPSSVSTLGPRDAPDGSIRLKYMEGILAQSTHEERRRRAVDKTKRFLADRWDMHWSSVSTTLNHGPWLLTNYLVLQNRFMRK